MKNRHPTKKKVRKSTHPLPLISLGKRDRDLLRHLNFIGEERFNIRDYALNIAKIPKSSVYDILNRLERKGFVNRELANNTITKRGVILLESQEKGVGASRRECRKNKLSTHYHKFKLPISNKENFSKHKLERLNPEEIKENKLNNLHQIIVKFNDATILINPNQVIINLFDVISKNIEDSDLECMNRAIEYAKKLKYLGLETEGIMLETGHWARVESQLSNFLYKIDNRYFLDLKDGSKFWIDHSNDKREDETNSKIVRERVDQFLGDVADGKLENDINKIKDSLGFITQLEARRVLDKKEKLNKMETIETEPTYNYFG